MTAYRLPDGRVFVPDASGELREVPPTAPDRADWERYALDVQRLPIKEQAPPPVLASRNEASGYVAAVAAMYLGLACLLLGGAWLVLAALLVSPATVFCGYLAQRERRVVSQGDYLIEYRIGWRRSALLFGALLPDAVDRLRSGGTAS